MSNLAGKRVRPVYRNEGPGTFGAQEMPFVFGGRGRDVAFDLQDVDTGKIAAALTEREDLRLALGILHKWREEEAE